jgi:ABC-2 type transport system ATP-binding protein
MSHAIVTRGLTKYYGNRPVVHALDLQIPTGCVYGFLGRNGAGKSTTIKMLTGMVHASSGTAELLGEPAGSLSTTTLQRISYLAEGHPLYRWMTIDGLERLTQPFYPKWDGELFRQIIEHFELPGRVRVRKFSKGQQAQVALALAVAPDPELLILDDPTLGLDTVVRRDFLESMIQVIQRGGRTILFSSHILGNVERVADRIGIMVNGVLRVDCETDRFKESVRKVVLEYDGAPPPYPLPRGVVSDRSGERRRELIVANYGDDHRAAAEQTGARAIHVVEMNLEDSFIEYTRGKRPALPLFTDRKPLDRERVGAGEPRNTRT